jgi:signal transduction histidine kinase
MARRPPPVAAYLVPAGIVAWLLVSLPTVIGAAASPRLPIWLVASLAYGLAFVAGARLLWSPATLRLFLAVQVVAVIVMVGTLCNGFEGALLVMVAAQLALHVGPREAAVWVTVQTSAIAVAIALHWAPGPALRLTPPYLGLQIFALFTLRLLSREAEVRQQRARLEERLRISQDLHDALGHHLTAMTLNLELAIHKTTGVAQDSVRTAQALARSLLDDVKDIVRELKDEPEIDIASALTQLAQEIPSPRIHLGLPGDLADMDPACARTLLRCMQEIVTNAIRHGSAENLWIDLSCGQAGLGLAARDDGQGVALVQAGNGLRGMRRRLQELGGTLAFESRPGAGFTVHATIPPGTPP